MNSPLPAANAVDIVRAYTKDLEYIHLLESSIHEILLRTLSNSIVSNPKTKTLTSKLTRLIYYVFTPKLPLPTTPGEEYAGILPIHSTMVNHSQLEWQQLQPIPINTRIMLAVLHTIDITDIVRLLISLLRGRRRSNQVSNSKLSSLLDALLRLHLSLFYIRGIYRTLPNRFSSVKYVQTSQPIGVIRGMTKENNGLPLLGVLLALQACGSVLKEVIKIARSVQLRRGCGFANSIRAIRDAILYGDRMDGIENERDEDINEEMNNNESMKSCILCLGKRKHPTVTTCGHVFCWECICGWCDSNEICPLCRQEVKAEKLVCLYNYE